MDNDWMECTLMTVTVEPSHDIASINCSLQNQMIAMDGQQVDFGSTSVEHLRGDSMHDQQQFFLGKEEGTDSFQPSPPPYHAAMAALRACNNSEGFPVLAEQTMTCSGGSGSFGESRAALCLSPSFPSVPVEMDEPFSPDDMQSHSYYSECTSPIVSSPQELSGVPIPTRPQSNPGEVPNFLSAYTGSFGEYSLYTMDPSSQAATTVMETSYVPQLVSRPQSSASNPLPESVYEEEQQQYLQGEPLSRPLPQEQSLDLEMALGAGVPPETSSQWFEAESEKKEQHFMGEKGYSNPLPESVYDEEQQQYVQGEPVSRPLPQEQSLDLEMALGAGMPPETSSQWFEAEGEEKEQHFLGEKEKLFQQVVNGTTDEELVACTRKAVETNDHTVLTKLVLKRKLELEFMNKGQPVPDLSNFPKKQEKQELRPDEKEKEDRRKLAGRISAKTYRDKMKLRKQEQEQALEEEGEKNADLKRKISTMEELKREFIHKLQQCMPREQISEALRKTHQQFEQERSELEYKEQQGKRRIPKQHRSSSVLSVP